MKNNASYAQEYVSEAKEGWSLTLQFPHQLSGPNGCPNRPLIEERLVNMTSLAPPPRGGGQSRMVGQRPGGLLGGNWLSISPLRRHSELAEIRHYSLLDVDQRGNSSRPRAATGPTAWQRLDGSWHYSCPCVHSRGPSFCSSIAAEPRTTYTWAWDQQVWLVVLNKLAGFVSMGSQLEVPRLSSARIFLADVQN